MSAHAAYAEQRMTKPGRTTCAVAAGFAGRAASRPAAACARGAARPLATGTAAGALRRVRTGASRALVIGTGIAVIAVDAYWRARIAAYRVARIGDGFVVARAEDA